MSATYLTDLIVMPGKDDSPVTIVGASQQSITLPRTAATNLAIDLLADSERYSVKDNETGEWLA